MNTELEEIASVKSRCKPERGKSVDTSETTVLCTEAVNLSRLSQRSVSSVLPSVPRKEKKLYAGFLFVTAPSEWGGGVSYNYLSAQEARRALSSQPPSAAAGKQPLETIWNFPCHSEAITFLQHEKYFFQK